MISRGEVWWASLPPPRGSGPGGRRPVLVVQADSFNRSRLGTATVVVISSNTKLTEAPGNVPLASRDSRLPGDSVANVSQVLTIDSSFLTERVGELPTALVERIDSGLRLALAL
ncbi:MAG: type II toxin-antitoxin system PemK/MazF family toxin [Candidatus Limnocylindrales bacterium]